MTVREAAEFLEMKPSTVYKLCTDRKLAHYRLGGRGEAGIRIDRADAAAFKASRRVEAVDEPAKASVPPPARARRSDWRADLDALMNRRN